LVCFGTNRCWLGKDLYRCISITAANSRIIEERRKDKDVIKEKRQKHRAFLLFCKEIFPGLFISENIIIIHCNVQ
jgi:hypothetical protein